MMASSSSSIVDKDQVFWDALMTQKVKNSKVNKKNASASGIDTVQLAAKFGIDKTDVDKVLALFCRIDCDSSGSLTAPEIATGMTMFGQDVSPKIVQAVMRASDKNGDGEINFEEFLQGVVGSLAKIKLKQNKKNIKSIREYLAKHPNVTSFDVDALVAVFKHSSLRINDAEAKWYIAHSNGVDGRCTVDEFIQMWENI